MLLYAYVKYILRIYGISQLYIREVSMFISYDYYRIFYYVAKIRQHLQGSKSPAEQSAQCNAHN